MEDAKRDIKRVSWLFLASLALHLAYLYSPWPIRNHFPMDEGMYWDLASNLVEKSRLCLSGNAFATVGAEERTLFWTPAYPILLAAILKLGIDPPRVIGIVQAVMTSSLPVLLFPVARLVLQGKWLFLFLAFSAAYPYYFQLSSEVGSEVTALFLSLACLALALATSKRTLSVPLLGTFAAWLCLSRPEFLVFSLLLLGWFVARNLAFPGQVSGRSLVVLLLAFSFWMGLWLYRNYTVTETLAFTTRSGYSLAYQNEYYDAFSKGRMRSQEEWIQSFPEFATEMERFRYLEGRSFRFIREHPGIYLQLCGKRIVSFFLPQAAKQGIYRMLGRKDIKETHIPFWFRMSNWFFLVPLWLLVMPAVLVSARRFKSSLDAVLSPPGLLALLILGQFAVYGIFAYIEYQRSIMDMEIFLLGVFLVAGKPGSPMARLSKG